MPGLWMDGAQPNEERGKPREDFTGLVHHTKFLGAVNGFVVNHFTYRFHADVYF